jgi:hypothetical protein
MVSVFGYEQSYYFWIQELWWECIVICIRIKKGVRQLSKKERKRERNKWMLTSNIVWDTTFYHIVWTILILTLNPIYYTNVGWYFLTSDQKQEEQGCHSPPSREWNRSYDMMIIIIAMKQNFIHINTFSFPPFNLWWNHTF